MKILLVYPHYPESFWSFKYALKFIGRKASFPPLGLLTVAAMLPHVGIETPYEESHAESGKVQNRNRDLLASVKRIQRAGLQVHGGFIVGFDSDPPSIFDKRVHK